MAAPKLDAWGGGGIMERREGYGADGAAGNVVPLSCSTRLSNDVLEHIRRAKLGAAALEFCLYMHRKTFGDAGYHRKQGREETGCAFDLAQWAAEIPSDRSNVRRVRDQLAACGILTFEADPDAPGCGTVAWNVRFEEWLPYDGRRATKQQPSMVISTPDQDKITMLARSKQPRSVAQNNYASPLKITMLASHEGGNEAGPESLLRKGEEREIIANAMSAAAADAPPDMPASPSETQSAAVSTVDASQTPPMPRRPPKATKAQKPAEELTPRKQYQIALMDAVTEANGARPPEHDKQWGAAGTLFDRGVPLETAIACYREEVRRPKWDSGYCPVTAVLTNHAAYQRSPDNFRRGIERQRAAADGQYDKPRASPLQRPAPPAPTFVPAGADDIWT